MASDDGCRSPSESRHQALFKASTPPWKETYRKRFLERLVLNRRRFLEKIRWNGQKFGDGDAELAVHSTFLKERSTFPMENGLPGGLADGLSSEEVDAALADYDEMTKELREEEERIVAEHEANERIEEDEMLAASIERLYTDEVICPICQKSPLFIDNGIVSCKCGIRIDTEQDAVTLDMIKKNLDEGIREHSLSCGVCPKFGVLSYVGIQNILMTCEVCDFMYVVV